MKFPRNLSANELIKSLNRLGYQVTRQSGSHMRLSCLTEKGIHHITVPNHRPIKIGTLNQIIQDIAHHFRESKHEILKKLGFHV